MVEIRFLQLFPRISPHVAVKKKFVVTSFATGNIVDDPMTKFGNGVLNVDDKVYIPLYESAGYFFDRM